MRRDWTEVETDAEPVTELTFEASAECQILAELYRRCCDETGQPAPQDPFVCVVKFLKALVLASAAKDPVWQASIDAVVSDFTRHRTPQNELESRTNHLTKGLDHERPSRDPCASA